ncbi:putative RNA methyltransferase pc1998 [Symbiodinium microadriaticum]|uniref:Putative RNA methyltransferase pc1998 n=2 Tax=Symbiodinium TaxID=2949 RepID=A0A1Q9E5F5_SYMMI|nr:putative RNA methyltransferase pc1998 [Symbiodinium microadriaticum]
MADPLPWTPLRALCGTNFLGGNGVVVRLPRPLRPAGRDQAARPVLSTRSAVLAAAVSWPSARRLCRSCLGLREQRQGKVSFKELLRSSDAPLEKASCAEWGCRCSLEGKVCPFTWREPKTDSTMNPEIKVFRAEVATGYRTTGKMAIGPGRLGACVIGLFKKGGWKVVPVRDCQANHPAIVAAIHTLQEVLDELHSVVKPFNHDGPAKRISREGLLRYVEFSLERSSGLVRLVLVWNGRRGEDSPQLMELLQKLWPQDAGTASFGTWHSIWVHWREPDPSLLRAIHSKKPEAWEQVRPNEAVRSAASGEVVECLDGLSFAFGPASFRQPNLDVFEQILRMLLLTATGAYGYSSTTSGSISLAGRPMDDDEILEDISYLTGRGLDGYRPLQRAVQEAEGAPWIARIHLNSAVMTGNITTLRYLVDEVGVKTLNTERKGYTPLEMAVVWGQVEILVYLLTRGADPLLWRRGKSVVDKARLRQTRLQDALKRAAEQLPDPTNMEPEKIEELYEKGKVMLEVLEGLEREGSYYAWATRNRSSWADIGQGLRPQDPAEATYGADRAVGAFSGCLGGLGWGPDSGEKGQALVQDGRARLRPISERQVLAAGSEGEPLTAALTKLGLGSRAHELQDALRACTVEQLREQNLTREDFDSLIRDVLLLGDGEYRRLWRFIMELQEQTPLPKASSSKSKAAPAAKALMAMPRLKGGKGQRKGCAVQEHAAPDEIDGLSLIFHQDLPEPAFLLVVRFTYGLRLGNLFEAVPIQQDVADGCDLSDMKSSLCELVAGDAMQSSQHLRILELCGGVGVIGISLADAVAKMEEVGKVTLLSTDVNPNCAAPFYANAERNFGQEGREGLSLEFSALKASEALASLAGPECGADVLVLDPPRRGLALRRWVQGLVGGEAEAAAIRSSSVRVSGTAAAKGTRLCTTEGCYDMFPFTEHIETLGIFVREEVGDGKPPESIDTWRKDNELDMLQVSQEDLEFNVRQRIFGERGIWRFEF